LPLILGTLRGESRAADLYWRYCVTQTVCSKPRGRSYEPWQARDE